MASKQINPKLIQALTSQPLSSLPKSPTFKHLGGTYVKMIVDQLKKIETPQPKSYMKMTCTSCSHRGTYDIGVIAISEANSDYKKMKQQYTGYFRCENCNAGSEWEKSEELSKIELIAANNPQLGIPIYYGEIQLADGYIPIYATDSEEHLLRLISNSSEPSFLWTKLGNHYLTGSRPELAMAAFEKAISYDSNQVEAHLSIANLLTQVKAYKQAIEHLHQMMLSAANYPYLEAVNLRELLAHGILASFLAADNTKYKYPALPTKEVLLAHGIQLDVKADSPSRFAATSPEDVSALYPFAEMFMGTRAQELRSKPNKKKNATKITKRQQVQSFIESQSGYFTKKEIQEAYPNISLQTISKVVAELRKAGILEMTGTNIDIKWRRV